jgi:hypothetical protein
MRAEFARNLRQNHDQINNFTIKKFDFSVLCQKFDVFFISFKVYVTGYVYIILISSLSSITISVTQTQELLTRHCASFSVWIVLILEAP